MILFDQFRHRIEAILTTPGKELGRWARFVRFQIQLWRFCLRRLHKDNALAMSAALSFRTLFAMIPALVLAILVVRSVGLLDDGKDSLRRLLEASGMSNISVVYDRQHAEKDDTTTQTPQQKQLSVADKIEALVERVEEKITLKRIGPVGGALLIWTALTLLTTIERSLNRIYGARQSRPLGRRIMLYWSVLTLGPIMIVLARYVGGKAIEVSTNVSALSWLFSAVGWVGPILVGIILLAALYKLVPNTPVSFRAAIGGALVAVPIWLVAKWGFGLYVGQIVGKGSIYGALGLLPVFLMWLNLSWWIFLFGAEISQTAANLSRMQSIERASRIVLGPAELLAAAFAVARPYHAGQGAVAFERVTSALNLPDETVEKLLDRLRTLNVICPVEDDSARKYVLSRPADMIPIAELLGISRTTARQSDGLYDDDISAALDGFVERTHSSLGTLTLADAIAGPNQHSLCSERTQEK